MQYTCLAPGHTNPNKSACDFSSLGRAHVSIDDDDDAGNDADAGNDNIEVVSAVDQQHNSMIDADISESRAESAGGDDEEAGSGEENLGDGSDLDTELDSSDIEEFHEEEDLGYDSH